MNMQSRKRIPGKVANTRQIPKTRKVAHARAQRVWTTQDAEANAKSIHRGREGEGWRMTNKPYQGYANYETWAVALWLDNDQRLYHESRSVVSGAAEDQDLMGNPGATVYRVAEELERWVKGIAPDLGPTVWAGLLTSALGEVDWHELADGYLAEYREEQEAGR